MLGFPFVVLSAMLGAQIKPIMLMDKHNDAWTLCNVEMFGVGCIRAGWHVWHVPN